MARIPKLSSRTRRRRRRRGGHWHRKEPASEFVEGQALEPPSVGRPLPYRLLGPAPAVWVLGVGILSSTIATSLVAFPALFSAASILLGTLGLAGSLSPDSTIRRRFVNRFLPSDRVMDTAEDALSHALRLVGVLTAVAAVYLGAVAYNIHTALTFAFFLAALTGIGWLMTRSRRFQVLKRFLGSMSNVGLLLLALTIPPGLLLEAVADTDALVAAYEEGRSRGLLDREAADAGSFVDYKEVVLARHRIDYRKRPLIFFHRHVPRKECPIWSASAWRFGRADYDLTPDAWRVLEAAEMAGPVTLGRKHFKSSEALLAHVQSFGVGLSADQETALLRATLTDKHLRDLSQFIEAWNHYRSLVPAPVADELREALEKELAVRRSPPYQTSRLFAAHVLELNAERVAAWSAAARLLTRNLIGAAWRGRGFLGGVLAVLLALVGAFEVASRVAIANNEGRSEGGPSGRTFAFVGALGVFWGAVAWVLAG